VECNGLLAAANATHEDNARARRPPLELGRAQITVPVQTPDRHRQVPRIVTAAVGRTVVPVR